MTPTLFSVGQTHDLMILTWYISVKVEVPQIIKDNKMNDTEGICARQSRYETGFK